MTDTATLAGLDAATLADVLRVANSADFDRWQEQIKRTGGCSDAHYPKRSEVALLELAAREGEIQRSFYLLFGVTIEFAFGAAIAASKFENIFPFLQSFVSAFSAWHKSLLLCPLSLVICHLIFGFKNKGQMTRDE